MHQSIILNKLSVILKARMNVVLDFMFKKMLLYLILIRMKFCNLEVHNLGALCNVTTF